MHVVRMASQLRAGKAACEAWRVDCGSQSALCAKRGITSSSPKKPVFEAIGANGADRYTGALSGQPIRAWYGKKYQEFEGAQRLHRLDEEGLRQVRTSQQPALVRFDMPGCTQCSQLDPLWQLIATNLPDGSTWTADCAATPEVSETKPGFGAFAGWATIHRSHWVPSARPALSVVGVDGGH